MAKRKSNTSHYKSIAFRNCGPQLTRKTLEALPVSLPEAYQDFLLTRNGGVPIDNAFRYPFKGTENISTIDYFSTIFTRFAPNRFGIPSTI